MHVETAAYFAYTGKGSERGIPQNAQSSEAQKICLLLDSSLHCSPPLVVSGTHPARLRRLPARLRKRKMILFFATVHSSPHSQHSAHHCHGLRPATLPMGACGAKRGAVATGILRPCLQGLAAVVMHAPPILLLRAGITVGPVCIATQQVILATVVENCSTCDSSLQQFTYSSKHVNASISGNAMGTYMNQAA